MAGTITGIGGRQQIWNLGNNMIDTSNFVELEMNALDMRKHRIQLKRIAFHKINFYIQV